MKIVFTNGCFDLLHYGHIYFLEESKKLGDLLYVGLNTDNSVKKLKGRNRPIINEDMRFKMLMSLKCVDMVFLFDEETPIKLIKKIKPNVLVKGNESAINEIVGFDYVLNNNGIVAQIKLIDNISTTILINKIQNMKG